MTPYEKMTIGARIAAARLLRRPRPFFLQYSLLNACNAGCLYCNSPHREDPQLSTAEHLRLLREFAALGTVRVKFLGGEPLLREDVGTLVQETRRLGMRAAMVTNGFLVPDRLDVITQLSELVISIDGDQAAHDRQRGHGTWARVMRAIDTCVREDVEFFLSAVVTAESADQIPWLIDLARRLGVMVNFQLPQTNLEMYGARATQMAPSAERSREIVREIIAAKEAGAPVLFTTRSYRTTLDWADYKLERLVRPGEPTPCSAGTSFLQVEPNGDVYPCVLHIGHFTPRNALRDGAAAAWEHARQHSCHACYNTWLNENRGVFSLHPSILANFWRHYLRPRA